MLFESFSSPCIYVLGDFNSKLRADDQGHVTSKLGKLLSDHCNDENLHVANVECLGNDSYTVISYAHNIVSWLDHIITTSDEASIVTCLIIVKTLCRQIICPSV